MDNWYEILGVSEGVRSKTLKQLRTEKRREHHPDHHESDPPETRKWHTEKFMLWEEGVSFLLNKTTRDKLDQHLKATRAAAEREDIRRRNAEDAKRRGDAADLRAQFGSRPRPVQRESSPPRPSPGFRPPTHRPTPPRSPVKVPHSSRSEAGVVLALDEFPPVEWGAVAGRLIGLVASLALLGSPFYIMSATGAASNDHLSGGALIELGCFALFVVGLAAVACALGAMFSRD